METVKRLKDMLIRHEGLKLKPYLCTAGKLTIGVGRNIQDRGITYQEAMMLLENDIRLIKAQRGRLRDARLRLGQPGGRPRR